MASQASVFWRSAILVLALWTVLSASLKEIRVNQASSVSDLSCHNSSDEVEWWVLPNQEIVLENQTSIDSRVSVDNGLLTIIDTKLGDEGTYLCAYYNNISRLVLGSIYLEVVPLLVEGKVWQEYGTHFITGFVAAGVVAGLIVFGCLVFKFRWKGDKRGKEDERDRLAPPHDFEGVIADERF